MDITNKNVKIISIEMVVENVILQQKKKWNVFFDGLSYEQKISPKFMLFRH